ncbi:Aste57867_10931 [Aphanomyces stellatus]|uniref:Aste57867_10931 protein n=1 Tax=Aphanomyces stellatus TaxID=120398 RepID=A0A485KSB7_9STRA|nr:hypothetical protein As57867_010891 [Aphanomyces stellatus]VFT87799.1 Aste57867_10931 [Aphanomyces stellatus]
MEIDPTPHSGSGKRRAKDLRIHRRMSKHGGKKKTEFDLLNESINRLLGIKSSMLAQRSLLLPWRDVAAALKGVRREGDVAHEDLQTKLRASQVLVGEMYQWVTAHFMSIKKPPHARHSSWRNVSLPGNPASRVLAKEWILAQLLHNSDRVFQDHDFPPIDADDAFIRDFRFSFDDGDAGYSYVTRHFGYLSGSMADLLTRYRRGLLTHQTCVLDLSPSHPRMIQDDQGNVFQHALITPRGEYVNLLCGVFDQGPNRMTLVGRQIQDDELLDPSMTHHRRQRDRFFIADMHRMPDGRVKGRGLWSQSQSFVVHQGPMSLDEDAIEYDIDLRECPNELKQARYPRLFEEAIKRYLHALHLRMPEGPHG